VGRGRSCPRRRRGKTPSRDRLPLCFETKESRDSRTTTDGKKKVKAVFRVEYPSFFRMLSRCFRGVSEPEDSASW